MFDCYFIHVIKLITIHDLKLFFHGQMTDRFSIHFHNTVNRLYTFLAIDCMTVMNMHRRKEMFYLTTHSTHFMYSYMASDIW